MRGKIGHYTVAFLDVMGFKKMVSEKPVHELANRYEYWLIDVPNHLLRPDPAYSAQPTLFPEHPPNMPLCQKHVFSDSIILISNSDKGMDCLKLLVYAWRLTQSLIGCGFPVRGGITHGEMYINNKERLYLGQALTAAYELEQKQDWIGVSIQPNLWNYYPKLHSIIQDSNNILSDLFFEYEVPLKNGSARMHTLNWRWNLIVKNGTRSLFPLSYEKEVYRKQQNTLDYAKAIRDSARIYIQDQKDLPVELRSYYIGDTEPPFPHGDDL